MLARAQTCHDTGDARAKTIELTEETAVTLWRVPKIRRPDAAVTCGIIAGLGCGGAAMLLLILVGSLLMTLNVI